MDRPKRSAGKPKHLHDEVDFTEAAIRRRPTKGKGVSKRKTPAVPKVVKAPPKARTSRVGRRKTVWDQEDASALIAKTTLLGEGVLPPSRPAPSTIWQLALASEPDSFSRYVNPCYLAAGPNPDLAPLVPAIQTYMAQLADEVQARHLDKAVEAQSKVRFQVGSANTTGSVVVADNLSKLFSQASGPACAGPAVLLSNRILPTLLHLLSPPGATQFNTPTVTNFPAGADHYTHDVLNVAAAWTAGVNGKTAPFSGNSFLRFTARDGARGQDVAVYYHAGLRVFLVFELRQPNGQATTATSTTDSAAPSATNGTANSTSVPTFTPQTNSVFGTGDGAVNIQHLMTDEAMQLTTDPAAALEALTSSNQLPNAAGSAAPGTPSDVSTATTALGTVNHESQSRPQGHSLVEGRLLSAWPVNVPTETYVPAPPEVQVGFWVHLAWHFLCRNFNLTCHAPIIDMSLNSLSQAYGTAQKSYFGRDVASSSTLAHSSAVVSNVSALDLPSNHADAYSRPTTSTATGTAKPFPMLGLPPC